MIDEDRIEKFLKDEDLTTEDIKIKNLEYYYKKYIIKSILYIFYKKRFILFIYRICSKYQNI